MYKYDFAISFAGEQREIAESLALKLVEKGIRVFYDSFELHELWGEDLAEKLFKVYSEESRYCIILASKQYLEKMWTTHERKSALQKQITQRGGYILPLRIDDISLPGLPDTIGYINFKERSIDEIAELAQLKLGLPGSDLSKSSEIPNFNEREEIEELSDKRIERHSKLSNLWFTEKEKKPFYQLESISRNIISIKHSTFQSTFLDSSKRYSESLFYARSPEIHFAGYTRKLIYPNPDRLIEAVTCYNDGLIVTEGYIDENRFNPNFFIYNIQRHLQLSKEIFEQYLDEILLQIIFTNLNEVVWEIYRDNHIFKTMRYGGYHSNIAIPVKINEIHGRDKWNMKMDIAEFALLKIARIFGLDRLPRNYWDNNNMLDYAKVGER